MRAMERLMEGSTTLMIAHGLSKLANFDFRVELEDGRVHRMARAEGPGMRRARTGQSVP
jgi:ABC-type multidrug transport system fused ATPase/permease subunit